jgi:hypothetical protein
MISITPTPIRLIFLSLQYSVIITWSAARGIIPQNGPHESNRLELDGGSMRKSTSTLYKFPYHPQFFRYNFLILGNFVLNSSQFPNHLAQAAMMPISLEELICDALIFTILHPEISSPFARRHGYVPGPGSLSQRLGR